MILVYRTPSTSIAIAPPPSPEDDDMRSARFSAYIETHRINAPQPFYAVRDRTWDGFFLPLLLFCFVPDVASYDFHRIQRNKYVRPHIRIAYDASYNRYTCMHIGCHTGRRGQLKIMSCAVFGTCRTTLALSFGKIISSIFSTFSAARILDTFRHELLRHGDVT